MVEFIEWEDMSQIENVCFIEKSMEEHMNGTKE